MKKKTIITAFAAVLTLFAACYQDVEIDAFSPGSLERIAGAYNFRDVGGYQTYNDYMGAGRALQGYQTSGEALGAFQTVLQTEAPKLNSGGAVAAAALAAINTAFVTLKAALPNHIKTLTPLSFPTAISDGSAGIALSTIATEEWAKVQAAFPDPVYGYGLSAILPTDRNAIKAKLTVIGENLREISAAKKVKRGVLYRSGDLSRLTDRDIKYIRGLGVEAVIDFRGIAPQSGRSGTERYGEKGENKDRLNYAEHGIRTGEDPDPYPVTAGKVDWATGTVTTGVYPRSGTYIGKTDGTVGVINIGTDPYTPKFGDRFAIEEGVVGSMDRFLGVDNSIIKTANQMIDGYQAIIKTPAGLTSDLATFLGMSDLPRPYEASGVVQFHNFFMYLLYPNGVEPSDTNDTGLMRQTPERVIFHCSAGKDRTGIAAALLYSALGIPREAIIQDYLLSAKYVAEKYWPVISALGQQMEPLVSVKREYIESFFGYIDTEFAPSKPQYAYDANIAVLTGYGVDAAIAGKNVYPNVPYDKSAAVIQFLTAPINGQIARADPPSLNVIFHGGLGLTLNQIYQLRKLYLE